MFEDLSLPLPRIAVSAPSVAEVDVASLVEAHAATLFRVAHAVLRNRTEAEDTVQDAFVRVLEHRGDLPAVREVRPWLIRMTWNLAIDRRRRTRPEQADALFLEMLTAQEPPTDKVLGDAEQARRALRAMDRLPQPERQALLLSAIEELSTAEIGQVMGKTESAVRALLFRARSRLRTRLDGKRKGGQA